LLCQRRSKQIQQKFLFHLRIAQKISRTEDNFLSREIKHANFYSVISALETSRAISISKL